MFGDKGPCLYIGEYRVRYVLSGWTWATPAIYARRSFLGISYWSRVCDGESKPMLTAQRLLPFQMKEWFEDAVAKYERHKEAWREVGIA